MNQLTKIFDNHELTLIESDGELMFLLKDVCKILDIGNHRHVKTRIADDVVSNYPIQDAIGRTQQATFVNEDGLYDVILDSRKPEAKKFRKWITSEVIPSIRKYGAYMTPETIEQALLSPDTIIKLATNLKDEQSKRIKAEQERNEARNQHSLVIAQQKADQPYTTFGKVVSGSEASINVGAFAKLMYDNHGIKLGRNKMFKWLRDNGYLIKSGRERNNPKQQYIEQGLFETTATLVSRSHGDVESLTTLVTGKGQVRIAEHILN